MAEVGALIVTIVWLLPAARMLQLLYRACRWRRVTATVLSGPRDTTVFTRGSRRLVVAFDLPDGRRTTAIVGFPPGADPADPPRQGSPVDIICNPTSPRRAEAYHDIGTCLFRLALLGLIYAVVVSVLIVDDHRKQERHRVAPTKACNPVGIVPGGVGYELTGRG